MNTTTCPGCTRYAQIGTLVCKDCEITLPIDAYGPETDIAVCSCGGFVCRICEVFTYTETLPTGETLVTHWNVEFARRLADAGEIEIERLALEPIVEAWQARWEIDLCHLPHVDVTKPIMVALQERG